MKFVVFTLLTFFTCIAYAGHDNPPALIPTASFTATTVCQGFATEFTNNSSTQSGSIVANIWDFGDGNGSSVQNPKHTYTNAGTYGVTLTVINTQGDVDDFTATVTVHPSGNLNFAITSPNNCESSLFTITNLSNIASGSFTSYTWNYGDGSPTSPDFSTSHNYSDHGTYTITLFTTTNNNCNNSVTKSLEVYPEAVVDFEGEDVCFGTNTSFTNLTTVASGLVGYEWDFGDEETSVEVNPSHHYAVGTFTVELVATTEKGCVTRSSKTVTTFPMPEAMFSANDHCFGSEELFSNATTISAGTVSYSWSFGDGNTSTDVSPVHEFAAIGNYLVQLTATSDHQCSDSHSKYLYVSAKPVVNFSLENICLGQEAEFVNNSTIAEGVIDYTWDFGDGNTSSSIDPSHQYESYGSFDVTLSATNATGGCTESLTKEMIVNQQPVAMFTATDNCLDSLIRFKNESVFTGDDITYTWSFGNGSESTDTNPVHQYTSPQTYIVTLNALAANGCSDTYTKPVKAFPLPLVNFTVTNVCDTEEALFSNLTTISSGTITYNWLFGDNTNSNEQEPSHLYGSPGVYDVKLTVTSEQGCAVIREKQVTIFPLPVTDFEAPSVCDYRPMIFDNKSAIASGEIAEYLWDFGDETNSIVKNPSKSYLKDGSYLVKLISTSDRGCKTSAAKTVTVYPPVVADFSVNDVCIKEAVQTDNSSSISSGILSFSWDFGDGNVSQATSPFHTYAEPGVYTIWLRAQAETGCKDSVARAVAVLNLPEVSAGDDVTVSQGYSVQLQASGAYTYAWSPIETLDNSSIPFPVATPWQTTTYIVTGTDRFGCANTDSVTVFVEEEYRLVASNVLTPDDNGMNDTWVIQNAETFGDIHVRVYDRYGKLVFEKQGYQNDWRGTAGKDLLPDGAYYYYITFESSDKVYKGALTILRNKR